MKQPAVYILASHRNGTLYIGVTSDLVQRVWQHKNDVAEGFTSEHCVTYARLLRTSRRHGERDRPGKAAEEVESRMEIAFD
ncbi:MAG: Excinuclease subunit domain protein [Schlesneria sp.]|nr:Excinuclease subunit domain protein [Schlesneria sp.]